MSTIRVYELAKEVNKTNKEVLDFLKSKNIELTSHMSNVDETHANMVRDTYKKGNKTAQEGNSPAKQEDGEKPKKKIIQVFRPQNASHTSEKKQKLQEHRSEENRGTQDLKQENRNNNRPNNNRYKENGENRQGNRNNNGGENRPNNRFNKNNGESRPNNRGGNGRTARTDQITVLTEMGRAVQTIAAMEKADQIIIAIMAIIIRKAAQITVLTETEKIVRAIVSIITMETENAPETVLEIIRENVETDVLAAETMEEEMTAGVNSPLNLMLQSWSL